MIIGASDCQDQQQNGVLGGEKHIQEAQLLLGWPTVLPLTLTGHNLAKNRHLPLKRAHYEAYQAIFCTLKTTSGFIFLLPVV